MSTTMDVSINFIFANYEKKVIVNTNTRATGRDLKNLLYNNWPDGELNLSYSILANWTSFTKSINNCITNRF